ncbi:uncharacterized protein BJ171DRAFT_578268 [Polychytrium aggregatum]|uniref:uncharacterized protein n=1 Tax=Polychytrium aggregatum TaxID=110093 RepID=UPI0022FE7CDA|nr:uncharacterized protein BJ171DRAFT_578268 [Polychytrium aggregatum]KAI9207800.1 hypothetical protein BJ171DRAFT_578268 [Polychytrium aggregatum]
MLTGYLNLAEPAPSQRTSPSTDSSVSSKLSPYRLPALLRPLSIFRRPRPPWPPKPADNELAHKLGRNTSGTVSSKSIHWGEDSIVIESADPIRLGHLAHSDPHESAVAPSMLPGPHHNGSAVMLSDSHSIHVRPISTLSFNSPARSSSSAHSIILIKDDPDNQSSRSFEMATRHSLDGGHDAGDTSISRSKALSVRSSATSIANQSIVTITTAHNNRPSDALSTRAIFAPSIRRNSLRFGTAGSVSTVHHLITTNPNTPVSAVSPMSTGDRALQYPDGVSVMTAISFGEASLDTMSIYS